MNNLVCFKVEGLNLERQLNLLIKEGVPVANVRRRAKQFLTFCAPAAYRRKILDFFKEKCYDIQVEKVSGIAGIVYFFRRRLALLAALAVSLAALLYVCGFVWRVEFDCDAGVDRPLLESALKENGVWTGAKVSGIDYKRVQNVIFNSLPHVKYAGVSVKGCTLFIAVRLEELGEPIFDFKTPKDIVAEYAGTVTRVVVVSGTALVKKGDSVVKGQVLIQGKRTFPDQTQEDVCAIGEVWAQAYYTGEEQFHSLLTVYEKTGNKKKFSSFALFKFKSKEKNEKVFASQVVEESCGTLFPLPVKIITRTVYETKEVKKEQNFELFKSEYEQKALAKALAAFKDSGITGTEFTYEQNELGILVKAHVYSERKVSCYPN